MKSPERSLGSASRSTVPREAIKPVNMIHPLFNSLKTFLYNYVFVSKNPFLAHADKQCHTVYQPDKGEPLRFFLKRYPAGDQPVFPQGQQFRFHNRCALGHSLNAPASNGRQCMGSSHQFRRNKGVDPVSRLTVQKRAQHFAATFHQNGSNFTCI